MRNSIVTSIRLIKMIAIPSGWWAIGLVILWAYRVAVLWVQQRWAISMTTGDLVSFLWDIPLTAGLFSASRFATAIGNKRPRAVRLFVVYTPLILFAFGPLFARSTEFIFCALTGEHLGSDAFLYITLDNIKLLGDDEGPVVVFLFLTVGTVLTFALARDGRNVIKTAMSPLTSKRLLVLACLSLVYLAVPLGTGFVDADEHPSLFVPEARFVREWLTWRGAFRASDPSVLNLSPLLKQRFVNAGLMPERPYWKGFPLSRPFVDTAPFPYPKTANANLGSPNLVIVLVEQLDREFISAFGGELHGVMPELSDIAKRSTMVTEYRSVTQPTIHALVALLCSMHDAAPFRELNKRHGRETLERTPLSCLPQILKERGYRTTYIQGGSNTFANTGNFLRQHGFTEIFGMDEIKARYPDRGDSKWGIHDDALVEFSETKMSELEASRVKDGRPFFLMIQTIDMHSPGHPPSNCPLQKKLKHYAVNDSDSRGMIRTLYCTDKALGGFSRSIIDDPTLGKTTVLAITGDHPTSPMKFIKALRYRDGHNYSGWSGPLPLIIFDPTHDLPRRVPVLSGHIDLTPTLLHILGISNLPNAMTGFSIFGSRPRIPVLVGRMAPKEVALYRPGHTKSVKTSRLREMCQKNQPMIAGDPQALSACDLWTWVRWQDALWKYKLIVPEQQPSSGESHR
jgi:arylsulfatase A-like enzyme